MNQDVDVASMLKRIEEQTRHISTVENLKPDPRDVQEWSIPGFGAGARIHTSFGLVPVEALRRGDPVKTSDDQFLKVQYVDQLRLDRRFLLNHPEAQPVTIPKGAYGVTSPNQSIRLSGAQVVKLPSRFDQGRGKAAHDLIGQRHISRDLSGYFTYYVFHCGEPCTICIDGLWVEIAVNNPDISTE
jgi:hypothetical protein